MIKETHSLKIRRSENYKIPSPRYNIARNFSENSKIRSTLSTSFEPFRPKGGRVPWTCKNVLSAPTKHLLEAFWPEITLPAVGYIIEHASI